MLGLFRFCACALAAVLIYMCMADAIVQVAEIKESARTARFLAEQTTAREWARQTGDTARTALMWAGGWLVAGLLIWQVGRMWQAHLHAKREQQRIAYLFALHYLSPSAHVRIENVEGVTWLCDYSSCQRWLLVDAKAALDKRALLVDSQARAEWE